MHPRNRCALVGLTLATVVASACSEVDVVSDDGDGTTSSSASSSTTTSTTASTSASSSSGGGGDAGTYSAINLFTGAPRLAFLKRDEVRDLCFQLVLIGGSGSEIELGLDEPTGVELARVTHDADDCLPWAGGSPPPPKGEVVAATGLTGKLAISAPPCAVDVGAVMSFADDVDWTPASEDLQVSAVVIEGGCP